ncbi:MAG: GGDEF domain-containing protein [Lentisphaerae bacterium]|nr:GGDEF domain-containing protein [Lentisphaerota bacterium]
MAQFLRRILLWYSPVAVFYLALGVCVWWLPAFPRWAVNPVFQALPWMTLILAGVLGLCFTQTRITFSSLLLATTLLAAQRASTAPAASLLNPRLLLWAGLLIPGGLALLHRLRERGAWSPHGAARAAVTLLACGFLWLLPQLATWPSSGIAAPLAAWLPLPLAALLAALLCLPLMLIPKAYESHALGPLMATAGLCTLTALMCRASFWPSDRAHGILILFMSGAALLLLVAVLDSAWRKANMDELTQLPARHALKHHLARLGPHYSVGLIDIDHFKLINDRHGHDVGDQVLRFVASRLREHAPGRVYRYGGEEFLMVCEGDRADAHAVAIEAARRAIGRDPFRLRGRSRPRRKPDTPPPADPPPADGRPRTRSLRITASAGVAASRGADVEPFEVIKAADKALYRAKNTGRDRLCRAGKIAREADTDW